MIVISSQTKTTYIIIKNRNKRLCPLHCGDFQGEPRGDRDKNRQPLAETLGTGWQRFLTTPQSVKFYLDPLETSSGADAILQVSEYFSYMINYTVHT